MSVAISKLFSTAMNGRSKERPDLVQRPLPLEARLHVVQCRAGEDFLTRLFEPLGYAVQAERHPLDLRFSEWGEGWYYTVTLTGTVTLQALLQHLYVLIPVLDNDKHYWVGPDEVEKLLAKGESWLPGHPEKELIASRYLKYQKRLTRDALTRLQLDEVMDPDRTSTESDAEEERIEKPLSLNAQRMGGVLAALRASGARKVLDLGCGEGSLIRELLKETQFESIRAVDVSIRALERAASRLKLDRLPEKKRQRLELMQGSLTYRDDRLRGFDAAAAVEVIEHLDPPRLESFERAIFEFAQPGTVVVTTPNQEYNCLWESLPAGDFRHRDHRFEWTRAEFQNWANTVAKQHGYEVKFLPVGPEDPNAGAPTQMGIFKR